MSSAVIFPAQPEYILKGLSKLWTSLGQEEKQQGKPTVLRACAMTLVVATDEPDAGFVASQTISDLMKEHPGRGIVLAVSPEAEQSLQARVLAQCWKPFGKAQQICCEQIEIIARPESWPNVGPTLIGLTVADLPVIFWCRHSGAIGKAATANQRDGLEAVMNLATKVIIDSRDTETNEAIALLTQWRAEGRTVADLEWTRLTQWREPLAHVFDNAKGENRFENFQSIEIEHSDAKPGIPALYMAGWLSAPYKGEVIFRRTEGYAPGIHRISLRSDTEVIDFQRTSSDSATLWSSNSRARKYSVAEPSLTALLTEELAIMGSDPAFSAAFTRARELAGV